MYAIVKPKHSERNWLDDVETISTFYFLKDAKKVWNEILRSEKETTPFYSRIVKITRSGEYEMLTPWQNEFLTNATSDDERGLNIEKIKTLAWDMASSIERRDYFNPETKQICPKPKGQSGSTKKRNKMKQGVEPDLPEEVNS